MRFSVHRRRVVLGLLLPAALVVAWSGCEGPPPDGATPTPVPMTQQPPAPAASELPKAAPPSDAEAAEFAKSLEKILRSGDVGQINAATDLDLHVRRAIARIDLREDARRDLAREISSDLRNQGGMGISLAKQVSKGRSYHPLRVHRVGDECRVLFRLSEDELGNYFDFVLDKGADGKVVVVDYYDYLSCQFASDWLYRQTLCSEASSDSQLPSRLSPADQALVKHFDVVRQIERCVNAERYQDALNAYQNLPDSLRRLKCVTRSHMAACTYLPGEFDEAVRQYREVFSGCPGIDLLLVDYFTLRKNFTEAIACLDRLDRDVGGDTHLSVYRALFYMAQGDLASAKKYARIAVDANPDWEFAKRSLSALEMIGNTTGVNPAATSPPQGETGRTEPPSDKEAETFAVELAKAVARHDSVAIQAAIDSNVLCQRAMAGLNFSRESQIGVEVAIKTAALPAFPGFFGITDSASKFIESAKFVHLNHKGDERWALIRLVLTNGIVMYVDCLLVRHSDGTVLIADAYPFSLGQTISEMFHRTFLISFPGFADGVRLTTEGIAENGVIMSKATTAISKHISAGEYQQALDVYATLPDALRREKTLLSQRLIAAQKLDGKPYDEAVREYLRLYPKERNVNLVLIDAYRSHKMYDRMLDCVNELDKTVGGDPYLNVLRAYANLRKGEFASARQFVEKSLQDEADNPAVYRCLLAVSAAQGRFSETSDLLTKMKEKFPHGMPDLKSDSVYEKYLGSPEYRAWLKNNNE